MGFGPAGLQFEQRSWSQWQIKWQRLQAASDGARCAQTPYFLRSAV